MTEAVIGRLGFSAAVRVQAVALWRWATRRPVVADDAVVALSHSQDVRQMLAVVEILAAPLVGLMFPPWLRAPHLVLEAVWWRRRSVSSPLGRGIRIWWVGERRGCAPGCSGRCACLLRGSRACGSRSVRSRATGCGWWQVRTLSPARLAPR